MPNNRSYPSCGRGIRHWFAGDLLCSHCGMPKPSREVDEAEVKVGDYALLKIGSGSDWVEVLDFFPGAGDQFHYRWYGREATATVRSVVGWRTTDKGNNVPR